MTMKMIISDIDGTLIGNDRREPAELDKLAELIAAHKLPFTIASGRIQGRIGGLVQRLGLTLPVIGCNGASAKQGDRYLWNKTIPPLLLQEAVELADRLDMSVVWTDGEREYAYRRTPWIVELMDLHGRYDGVWAPTPSEWNDLTVQKVLIDDSGRSGRIEEVLALLARHPREIALVRYQGGTADVMPAGCSKGAALRQLAELLDIPLDRVLAVGDHQNDLEMIEAAGLGVAVGNATPQLKAAADYVCEQPLCAGVIEAVERFCVAPQPAP